jgi:hypothetical protein
LRGALWQCPGLQDFDFSLDLGVISAKEGGTMNEKQKKILICGLILLVVMTVFPPWISTFHYKDARGQRSEGYHFIGGPPEPTDLRYISIGIDTVRLFIQYLGVLLLTGLIILLVSRNERKVFEDKEVSNRSDTLSPASDISNVRKWIPNSRSAKIKED